MWCSCSVVVSSVVLICSCFCVENVLIYGDGLCNRLWFSIRRESM